MEEAAAVNGKRAKQIRRDARAIAAAHGMPASVIPLLVKGLKEKRIRRPPPPEEGARVKKSENPRSGALDG